ncbi:DUF3500 domain-containing protein [Poritiphilus flavus]|uniref:DUF3500 domain-containing protein n=1 Tax=Poritiphilus flavus TaxID=2697053 RepID=A0A6L9EC98_9FLAO|nr:DUF3500 domain-containing protein [Poritiphilus flavus]NAS12029.1 DUF3500 domain-containing protein [Poritiphilus flavus]
MKSVIFFLVCCWSLSQAVAQGLDVLATEFAGTLTDDLREQTFFELNDEERMNFNFVPVFRKGPSFHDFNEEQKQAALKLLRASLSEKGYWKATEIMSLEAILKVLENDRLKMSDGSPMRDELNYHFTIFGNPEEGKFWGWRFEGHHLSLNFVATKSDIQSATPSFMGANPAIVPSGKSKGKEVLKAETALGFKLVNALSDTQLTKARFSERPPREIITSNKREAAELDPKGISYADLTEDQQSVFMDLLQTYTGNYEHRFAVNLLNKVKESGLENLHFAWAGSLSPGAGHYYRIQGPSLLIEYANTQNDANHVHTVVRDLTNDFGADLLKEHYKKSH